MSAEIRDLIRKRLHTMPDVTTRPSEPHRRTPSPEFVSAVAHHEAGNAVATVLAFRNATWLPNPPPPLLVRYVEVVEGGNCFSPNIYSVRGQRAAESRHATAN